MWCSEEVMENLKQREIISKRVAVSVCAPLKVVLFLSSLPPIFCVLFVLMWKRIPCFILKLAPAPVGVQIALDSACDVCIFSLIEGTEVEYKIKTAQIGQLSALYNFPSLQVYTLREKLQECWKKKKKDPTKNPIKKSNMISLMSIKERKTHKKHKTLPAIYLTNELIFSDATLQRCEWKQTLHSHKMNDCFGSYSFFFVQKKKRWKKPTKTFF